MVKRLARPRGGCARRRSTSASAAVTVGTRPATATTSAGRSRRSSSSSQASASSWSGTSSAPTCSTTDPAARTRLTDPCSPRPHGTQLDLTHDRLDRTPRPAPWDIADGRSNVGGPLHWTASTRPAAEVRGCCASNTSGAAVEDLDAMIELLRFGVAFEHEGEGHDGRGGWRARSTGSQGVRAEIAMLRTPDRTGRLELVRYLTPVDAEVLPSLVEPAGSSATSRRGR